MAHDLLLFLTCLTSWLPVEIAKSEVLSDESLCSERIFYETNHYILQKPSSAE